MKMLKCIGCDGVGKRWYMGHNDGEWLPCQVCNGTKYVTEKYVAARSRMAELEKETSAYREVVSRLPNDTSWHSRKITDIVQERQEQILTELHNLRQIRGLDD